MYTPNTELPYTELPYIKQGESGVRFFIPLCGKAGDLMHLYKVDIVSKCGVLLCFKQIVDSIKPSNTPPGAKHCSAPGRAVFASTSPLISAGRAQRHWCGGCSLCCGTILQVWRV